VLDKDVDGVNTHGYGNMAMGIEAFHSCTPFGIMRLLDAYKVDCAGKLAIVVGRSQILGKPMSAMLLNSNATVLTAHSKTENLNELISMGDIIVAAVGKPKFIKANNLKKDSILIDAGYHPELNCGDVDMEGIEKIVSAYTPVPGGVGPMTINSLILNTVNSMEKRING
jgi:methylenetetrahydrofolate dehydrogenase (NADP+)/methenyltetrahydrofolate cyclohydrolase